MMIGTLVITPQDGIQSGTIPVRIVPTLGRQLIEREDEVRLLIFTQYINPDNGSVISQSSSCIFQKDYDIHEPAELDLSIDSKGNVIFSGLLRYIWDNEESVLLVEEPYIYIPDTIQEDIQELVTYFVIAIRVSVEY
jgi:hypothetical protein